MLLLRITYIPFDLAVCNIPCDLTHHQLIKMTENGPTLPCLSTLFFFLAKIRSQLSRLTVSGSEYKNPWLDPRLSCHSSVALLEKMASSSINLQHRETSIQIMEGS